MSEKTGNTLSEKLMDHAHLVAREEREHHECEDHHEKTKCKLVFKTHQNITKLEGEISQSEEKLEI